MQNNENHNFKEESFSNSMQKPEIVHYLGDLRIIGQVVQNIRDTEPIGYVIMTEKTQKFKMYTVEQTKSLLNKFKFVNAVLDSSGKIINTECSMTKIPKFNTHMQVIDNPGIIILGEIIQGSNKVGYRAMDTNARIIDISTNELVALTNKGINLINAKVVTSAKNKCYISGIKQEFTKIEKSKLDKIKEKTETKEFKWRKHKHNDKWFNEVLPGAIKSLFLKDKSTINDKAYVRETVNNRNYSYVDIDKEINIVLKEIYNNNYGITLSSRDKDLLKKILKLDRQKLLGTKHTVSTGERIYTNGDTRKFFILFAQFVLNNEEKRKEVLNSILRHRVENINTKNIEELAKNGLVSASLDKLYNDIIEGINAKELEQEYRENRIIELNAKKAFKTTNFSSAEDIAQLGFTISENNRGFKYTTKTGNKKTLLFLGDYISINYAELKEISRCLGDLASIAYIEKLLNKYYNDNNYHYMDKQTIKTTIEVIIIISYMFNSLAMKEYVEKIADKQLEDLDIHVSYDEIANVDYKLSKEITMYYTSGFNVFLNDQEYTVDSRGRKRKYHSIYLKISHLINYRQLGITHCIQHPMLQEELASIVTMLASDNCTSEDVEKVIGKLRFL